MYKNVGTICTADEPVSFCVIEPLYCPFQSFHEPPSFRTPFGGRKTCPLMMHFVAIKMGSQGETVVKNGVKIFTPRGPGRIGVGGYEVAIATLCPAPPDCAYAVPGDPATILRRSFSHPEWCRLGPCEGPRAAGPAAVR